MMNPMNETGGLVNVRAETPSQTDVQAALTEMAKTFEAFKAENDKKLADLEKGKADVLQDEKVARINDNIDSCVKEIDKINAMIASSQIEVGDDAATSENDKQYIAAFNNYARTGEGESDIKAMIREGKVSAAMSVGSGADGGLTAPVEWDRTITKTLIEQSPMRQICSVVKTGKTGFKKLYNTGGTTSGWVAETAARPTTANAQFAEQEFKPNQIYANPGITQDLLDDSEIDMAQWLAMEVAEEFAVQEGAAFINGDGNNKPTGILQYTAANDLGHPLGDIANVNSEVADGISADSIIKLVYSLSSKFAANAVFIGNRDTHGKLRQLKDGQNNYIWQPSYQKGQPATVLGFPIYEMPQMPNVAADATPLVFGDFKRGYMIIDRVGTRILRDAYTNKPYVHFYTTKRVGGQLLNPEALRYYTCAVSE